MIRKNIYWLAAIGVLLIYACSDGPTQNAGDVTETGNAFITGKIANPTGALVPEVEVLLIPDDYNPVTDVPVPDSAIDTTDSQGTYRFLNVQPGSYNILGWYRTKEFGVFVSDITADSLDTIRIGTDTVKKIGITIVDLDLTICSQNGYLYLPGTNISFKLDSSDIDKGKVILDNLPPGDLLDIRYYSEQEGDSLLYQKMYIVSGDTTRCPGPRCNRPF